MGFVQTLAVAPGSPSNVQGWLSNSVMDSYWVSGGPGTAQSVSGVSTYQNMYGYFRVIGYDYCLEVINTGNFPTEFLLVHTNSDPAALTIGQFRNIVGGGQGTMQLASPITGGAGSRQIFKGTKACAAIIGSLAYFTDDNYAGVIGASLTQAPPADRIHLILYSLTVSGNVTYTFTMSLSYRVELYNRGATN